VRNTPHPEWIIPDWPAPRQVRALITTRAGGVSSGNFAHLNLGSQVGDRPDRVVRNRAILRSCLPAEPKWIGQVHGAAVIQAADGAEAAQADGIVAGKAGLVCGVLTADCLPVLLCDRTGSTVGIAHAGWRGLAAGIIENVVRAMHASAGSLTAYLGPGIGRDVYEVGNEVRDKFVGLNPEAAAAFAPRHGGKFLADLYMLARQRLAAAGVGEVHGGGFCTLSESRFFSFRRDRITGRMASLIWLEEL
jgi:YfiH family protein